MSDQNSNTNEETKKRGRGRPQGSMGVCSYCKQTGHNKRTCPKRLQDEAVARLNKETS